MSAFWSIGWIPFAIYAAIKLTKVRIRGERERMYVNLARFRRAVVKGEQ